MLFSVMGSNAIGMAMVPCAGSASVWGSTCHKVMAGCSRWQAHWAMFQEALRCISKRVRVNVTMLSRAVGGGLRASLTGVPAITSHGPHGEGHRNHKVAELPMVLHCSWQPSADDSITWLRSALADASYKPSTHKKPRHLQHCLLL